MRKSVEKEIQRGRLTVGAFQRADAAQELAADFYRLEHLSVRELFLFTCTVGVCNNCQVRLSLIIGTVKIYAHLKNSNYEST